MKTWQGRISAGAHPLFEAFTSSAVQDQRLAPYDVRVSQAHARALARTGVISEGDAERLVAGLREIGEEIAAGSFVWRDELEDVHTHVEAALREKLGEPADALHAGRSRNDQIAADLRLYTKDQILAALQEILDLQDALLGLAERYQHALMPGYTHLQQAQPVLIAQPLLAYVSMLGRDWERLRDALARTDLSPLGSGALAGASFPLDRAYLAEQAGFGGVLSNSVDAVSDRDFLAEFVSDAALCMTHLSRFAEDLIFWSSSEARFLRLPDAFASGSSMMPQKKNPDVLELVRGKAALTIGDAAAALTLLKGLPLAYNRDLQEDKTPLFHASDTLHASLQVVAAMVPELRFDTDRTEQAISSFALATDLAEYLVRQGMPFRQAHAVVAGLVARCVEEGRELSDLTADEMAEASALLRDAPALSAQASVDGKQTAGSRQSEALRTQIEEAQRLIAERGLGRR